MSTSQKELAEDGPKVHAPETAVKPAILQVSALNKVYASHGRSLAVLKNIELSIAAGESCAIVGPSGSGKTTLLSICAGLDEASSGTVSIDGVELTRLSQDERAALRNQLVGFVFQSFQLIPTLTALENVLVPLELRGEALRRDEARDLLARLGLGERLDHYPAQLSGGEQQRVALARAFIHRPKLLFADEPTGNLDLETSEPIVQMLFDLNRTAGAALVLVTHDPALAARAQRTVRMRGGEIIGEERN